MNCVLADLQNSDCFFFSLSFSISLHQFPSAGVHTDTWWIERSACCWCCRLPAAEFCLLVIGDEIRREIEFAVVSVSVNYWRDFRVVIDVVLGLITCVSGQVGQGARDRTTRRSSASRAWRRRHRSRKGHRWRRGRRRWKADVKVTMREQQRRWMKHVWMWMFCARDQWAWYLSHVHTRILCTKCAEWRWHWTTRKSVRALQPPIVARVPLHLMSDDANHGQFRRLLNTLLETGSDILQTPFHTRRSIEFCCASIATRRDWPRGWTRTWVKPSRWTNRRHCVPSVPVHSSATHHYSWWTTVSLPLIFGFDLCCASKND